MKRYVSVRRSAAGATAVTVSLVDGDIAAKWTVKTYIGHVKDAVENAEAYALRALEEVREGLEPKPIGKAS
jgi:hypothetical protein